MTSIFKKIVCPVDLETGAVGALELAGQIAHQNDAYVLVIHAVADPLQAEGAKLYSELEQEQTQIDREAVLKVVRRHLSGVKHDVRSVVGDPVEVILKAAHELPADLVVMSSHGRRGLLHFLLGSVAETLVRQIPCPLLVTKDVHS